MSKREHIAEQSLLPSEYRQLKYIESTGTQYINTGISASNGFSWNLDFAFTEAQDNAYIVGSHNLSSPYGRNGVQSAWKSPYNRLWGIGTGNSQKLSYPRESGISGSSIVQYMVNQKYHLEGQTIKGDSWLNVDGTRTLYTNDSSSRSNNPIHFFTEQYTISKGRASTKGRLFGTVVFNINGTEYVFITSLRKQDSKPGLYLVNIDTFLTNNGTGEFLYN